ncbi:MAG: hypothetical protein CMJ59_03730 [Planctomycetaceae bacterium]|nr:hypothetical protein [Planctomycetaceae bacterium]
MCAVVQGASDADDTAAPIDIGSRRELFVDTFLVQRLEGEARQILQHPVAREIVLVCDQPWEGNGVNYVTVFQDHEIYRMYYRGADYSFGLAPTHPQTYCYAESRDGIHWTRPEVGLVEYDGSKKNNIVISEKQFGYIAHNFSPFVDARPGVPAAERFKAIGGGPLEVLASADGMRWRKLGAQPVITKGAFDSQNVIFWDAYRSSFRGYHRQFRNGRDIMTETSDDLIHWTEPVFLNYEPSRGGQLYTNQISPYHRAPHLMLGFPTRYEDRGLNPATRHLPQWKYRQARSAQSAREGTAVTEGLFICSRDGLNFHVWQEAFIRPGLRTKDSWFYGDNYQNWGLVETKSVLAADAPDELSMYLTEGTLQNGKPGKLRRYTLRMDGFVSVNAPMTGGRLVTKPIRFKGTRLSINYSSSARGGIRVGMLDERGAPVQGFTIEECPWIYGDSLDRTVEWLAGDDITDHVGTYAGKAVRLVFELKDADLFSFQFQ